ncbi:hypothetical protein ACFLXA_04680 [Chloroflexota bacterium]
MRRRYISDEELNGIIKLKESGASWLMIQDKTGVPRRSAKQAYEQWLQTKSSDELKKARISIAAEEFRCHMDDLVELAQYLANSLHVPFPMREIGTADEFMEKLWRKDISKKAKPYIGEREERRILRRNKKLYSSLREHTRDKLRWELLKDWTSAFDSYSINSGKLRAKVREVLDNLLNQHPDLKHRIEAIDREGHLISNVSIGVVESLWRAIMVGKPYKENVCIKITPHGEGVTKLLFGKQTSITELMLPEEKLAEEIASVCRQATINLTLGKDAGLLEEIGNDITKMEEKAQQLEEMLDDLMLRSIILKTSCELCPA